MVSKVFHYLKNGEEKQAIPNAFQGVGDYKNHKIVGRNSADNTLRSCITW